MSFKFDVMTQDQAEEIAHNWRYDGEYAFYNLDADEEDLVEFLDPQARGDSMFIVSKGEEMIAFLSVIKVAERTFDIGLGMRPDLTGNGNGFAFLKASMEFVQVRFSPEKITLAVACFNQRAIKVYRKIGFKDIETFLQDTNGSTYEFLKMVYEC